ncbi:hypothetical protein QQP08_027500 [Theobroma cacao]|nr:hypothetical protein QQP08_027500 [Theobroma cacao]
MADPNANDPDDDPHYVPLVDDALNFMNNMEPLLPDDDMNIFTANMNHPFMDDTRNDFLNNINPSLFGNSSLHNSDARNLRVNSQSNPSMSNLSTTTQIQQNFENEDLNNPHVPTRVNSTVQEPSQHPFIPQAGEKRMQPIKVNHLEELFGIFTHKKDNSNAGCSGSGPSKIHGNASNQGETNLVNESLNSPSIPTQQDLLPVREPVLRPSSIPPFTEREAINRLQIATNWEGMRNKPDLETSQADMLNESNLRNSQANKYNESNLENSQAASFAEMNSQKETSLETERLDKNKGKLSVTPSRTSPSDCSGCDMLREITHRKGYKDVEKFLSQYFIKQEQEGWNLYDDPRADFFKVLCFRPGGIQTSEATNTNISQVGQVAATGSHEATNPNNSGRRSINLKEQLEPLGRMDYSNLKRKRIKMLGRDDLTPYYGLPRREAARRLNVSETILHKIHGEVTGHTGGWPFRQISARTRKIAELTAIVDSTKNPAARNRAINEIQKLEKEIAAYYDR